MAITYKVRYKNHCTPQEQILTDGRWYLDSDCGRKLTGVSDTTRKGYWSDIGPVWESVGEKWEEEFFSLSSAGTLTTGVAISTSATSIASDKDFVYVKNTGSTEVVISLTTDATAKYVIALAGGEAFASEISLSANVRVKTLSGTSTIEHFSET